MPSSVDFVSLAGTHYGECAIVLLPGPSLASYDDTIAPTGIVRIASEDAILKCPGADFCLISHDVALADLAKHIKPTTFVLVTCPDAAKVDALFPYGNWAKIRIGSEVAGDHGDLFGYGSPCIASIDMAAYIGAHYVYVFGLDCYRTKHSYTFNNPKSRFPTENALDPSRRAKKSRMAGAGFDAYITPKNKRLEIGLSQGLRSGSWDAVREFWCVGSPWSQQDWFPKMTAGKFAEDINREIVEKPGALPIETLDPDVGGVGVEPEPLPVVVEIYPGTAAVTTSPVTTTPATTSPVTTYQPTFTTHTYTTPPANTSPATTSPATTPQATTIDPTVTTPPAAWFQTYQPKRRGRPRKAAE